MPQGKQEQEEKYLLSATSWQRRPGRSAEPIGNTIHVFLEQHVGNAGKNAKIAGIFEIIVNSFPGFSYRLDRVEKGTLYVRSLPGPAAHQMKMMEADIIEKINRECPKAKLRSIRLIINQNYSFKK